jgi:hypothetical protein
MNLEMRRLFLGLAPKLLHTFGRSVVMCVMDDRLLAALKSEILSSPSTLVAHCPWIFMVATNGTALLVFSFYRLVERPLSAIPHLRKFI